GKIIELRVSSPDKDAIVRASLLHDLLYNREKMEGLRTNCEGHNEERDRRKTGRNNNACPQPSPARLMRTSAFGDKARERLACENRQRWKHCQMVMPRKSPSNKDREITNSKP